MSRCAAAYILSLLVCGTVVQLSHGVEVNIKDKDDKLCLYAKLNVTFSVSYETKEGNKAANMELPDKVTTDGSMCGSSSVLKLNFGEGHSLSMNFSRSSEVYKPDYIIFSYNLSDSSVFPDSDLNGTKFVSVMTGIAGIDVDTCYSCVSSDLIQADPVNITLSNVLMQAFVVNGSKSEKVTICSADEPPTSAPPTTHITTEAPVTNSTSTTPLPPTTPTPTLPTPSTWTYNVTFDNSTVCLLAKFGLKLGFKQGENYTEINLEPNKTRASGLCGINSSELHLVSDTIDLLLTFTNDSAKFRLHALNVTVKTSSGEEFDDKNSSLSLWEAAVGSSYMCNKEQNYTITKQLSLYTFNLQVQPFGVLKGVFSTATECSLDDTSILIPIIVGAALAGLIVIVVIAYVIGRRKTYVGYQTL